MRLGRSVRGKLLVVVIATTTVALLLTGAAMTLYDVRTFRQRQLAELTAQADILGLATGAALQFEDPQSAQSYLAFLKVHPNVTQAAVYTPKGGLFAGYAAKGHEDDEFPKLAEVDGHTVNGNRLTLFKRIVADNEILGTVYLSAEYDLLGRLGDYAAILGLVLVASLGAALLMSSRLHKTVTGPIADITSVARRVMENRDFTPRASTTSQDELGVLATAFNSMLAEIDSRTQVLEESNQRLQTAEQSLRTLNAELEERVALRTAQLEAANKDLEGFSYSVSHDLRAPIRAIGGFCTLLTKDHQAQLDSEAQRKLGVIKSEAERMGALIDDLLAFSRLGRKALQPAEIDMAELASTAYKRLLNGHAQRSIDFRLGLLPRATADRSLLEQVWVNLLSNAIKFSSKKDAPIVEVGAIAEEREYVYFVRDNGAGFDPRYQEKLFGVFQRLHHNDEYPGTGVGLALVHRIVTRHGGRVWADGRPGEGATFHFTLPKEQASGRV